MSMDKNRARKTVRRFFVALVVCALTASTTLYGCAQGDIPGARNVEIPTPVKAQKRKRAINEGPDSVLYLPLGEDVLVPEKRHTDPMPSDAVGPFELREETLAGALQLILAEYDISLAFETEEGLTRTVTVANLKGPLDAVVNKVCGLADLYCSLDGNVLTVKETESFMVTIPPVTNDDQDVLDTIATGLEAITGLSPVVERGTRTLIYSATQRTADRAMRYFQRLRANTALIVFEIYIWEVSLDSGNATGIDWEGIETFGKFNTGVSITGSAVSNSTPVSIGLPTMGDVTFDSNDVLQFISSYGAVKTISQPQITLLSGSEATLRVADTINYVSSLERTVDDGDVSVSTQTDTVDTGFTLTINSAWDQATIYGSIEIEIEEFRGFDDFEVDGTTLRLPETTERELQTNVRIRPGDSLLIAGLVRESDEVDKSGPGFTNPLIPTSRSATASNVELVFLMRPRVVVYTEKQIADQKAAERQARKKELAELQKALSEERTKKYKAEMSIDTTDEKMPDAYTVKVREESDVSEQIPAPSSSEEQKFWLEEERDREGYNQNFERRNVKPLWQRFWKTLTEPGTEDSHSSAGTLTEFGEKTALLSERPYLAESRAEKKVEKKKAKISNVKPEPMGGDVPAVESVPLDAPVKEIVEKTADASSPVPLLPSHLFETGTEEDAQSRAVEANDLEPAGRKRYPGIQQHNPYLEKIFGDLEPSSFSGD